MCRNTCESTKTKGMRVLHSSTFDNRNVTKNNDPQYLRLEILHSVHYTRKTQNIEHEYSTIHFSSLRLVSFSLVGNRMFCIMHNNAQRHCGECRLLKASLSVEGSVAPNLLRQHSVKLQTRFARHAVNIARQTKSRSMARQTIFHPADAPTTTCVIIVNGGKECGGEEGNGLVDGCVDGI